MALVRKESIRVAAGSEANIFVVASSRALRSLRDAEVGQAIYTALALAAALYRNHCLLL